ncbi:MAG: hypothetical protein H6618_03070 [Deltaproteobacteria bacterium]|nr:hypothetical protein [Deltaproteobacteria bacterium]
MRIRVYFSEKRLLIALYFFCTNLHILFFRPPISFAEEYEHNFISEKREQTETESESDQDDDYIPYDIIQTGHYVIRNGHMFFPVSGDRIESPETEGYDENKEVVKEIGTSLLPPAIRTISSMTAEKIVSSTDTNRGINYATQRLTELMPNIIKQSQKIAEKNGGKPGHLLISEAILSTIFNRIAGKVLPDSDIMPDDRYYTIYRGQYYRVFLIPPGNSGQILESLLEHYTIYKGLHELPQDEDYVTGEPICLQGSAFWKTFFYTGKFLISLVADCIFASLKLLYLNPHPTEQSSGIASLSWSPTELLLNSIWERFKATTDASLYKALNPYLKLKPTLNPPEREPAGIVNIHGVFRWVYRK